MPAVSRGRNEIDQLLDLTLSLRSSYIPKLGEFSAKISLIRFDIGIPASCCISDQPFQWEKGNFDSPAPKFFPDRFEIQTHTQHTKFGSRGGSRLSWKEILLFECWERNREEIGGSGRTVEKSVWLKGSAETVGDIRNWN